MSATAVAVRGLPLSGGVGGGGVGGASSAAALATARSSAATTTTTFGRVQAEVNDAPLSARLPDDGPAEYVREQRRKAKVEAICAVLPNALLRMAEAKDALADVLLQAHDGAALAGKAYAASTLLDTVSLKTAGSFRRRMAEMSTTEEELLLARRGSVRSVTSTEADASALAMVSSRAAVATATGSGAPPAAPAHGQASALTMGTSAGKAGASEIERLRDGADGVVVDVLFEIAKDLQASIEGNAASESRSSQAEVRRLTMENGALSARVAEMQRRLERNDAQTDIIRGQLLRRNRMLAEQRAKYFKDLRVLREQVFQKERLGEYYNPEDWGTYFALDDMPEEEDDDDKQEGGPDAEHKKEIEKLKKQFENDKKKMQMQFQAQQRELQVQVERLTKELDDTAAANKKAMMEASQRHELQLAEQRESYEARLNEMESKFDEERRQMQEDKERELAESTAAFEEQLQEAAQRLEQVTAELTGQIDSLKHEMSTAQETIAGLEARVQEANEEAERAKESLQLFMDEKDRLERERDQLQRKLKEQEARFANFSAELDKARGENEDLRKQLSSARAEVSRLEGELERALADAADGRAAARAARPASAAQPPPAAPSAVAAPPQAAPPSPGPRLTSEQEGAMRALEEHVAIDEQLKAEHRQSGWELLQAKMSAQERAKARQLAMSLPSLKIESEEERQKRVISKLNVFERLERRANMQLERLRAKRMLLERERMRNLERALMAVCLLVRPQRRRRMPVQNMAFEGESVHMGTAMLGTLDVGRPGSSRGGGGGGDVGSGAVPRPPSSFSGSGRSTSRLHMHPARSYTPRALSSATGTPRSPAPGGTGSGVFSGAQTARSAVPSLAGLLPPQTPTGSVASGRTSSLGMRASSPRVQMPSQPQPSAQYPYQQMQQQMQQQFHPLPPQQQQQQQQMQQQQLAASSPLPGRVHATITSQSVSFHRSPRDPATASASSVLDRRVSVQLPQLDGHASGGDLLSLNKTERRDAIMSMIYEDRQQPRGASMPASSRGRH